MTEKEWILTRVEALRQSKMYADENESTRIQEKIDKLMAKYWAIDKQENNQ